MFSGYHLLTITYRTAALTDIGAILPPADVAAERYLAVKEHLGWQELMCLHTCNRAFFLFYAPQPLQNESLVIHFLSVLRPELNSTQIDTLAPKFRLLHGGDALRHLFEVAASMDSLVVGEREIIRQLREAYDQSKAWGLTGDHIRLALQAAIETSKQVYNETGIGDKALSVVALAFKAMQQAGITCQSRLVLVGAGQTNALLAKFLHKNGYRHVTVFNRSLDKAQAIADLFAEGAAHPLSALPDWKGAFDALVVCTSATEAIITPQVYGQMLQGDTTGKVVVDLSVPNNVSAETVEQFNLQFIEIEGLRALAAEHLAHRELARQAAESLISEALRQFRQTWHQRQVERSLMPMVDDIQAIKTRALEQVFARQYAEMDAATQAIVSQMLDYVVEKATAIPMKTIKSVAGEMSKRAAMQPK